MNPLLLLAAKAVKAPPPVQFQPLTRFPGQGDLLTWCQEMGLGTAILLCLIGVIYLLYGWKLFKPLITLNAAFLGGYIGASIGHNNGSAFVGAIIGCVLAVATTLPLMKWAVAVMGGVVGAVVGASVWRTAGLDPNFAWAGGMTGLVGFGMFSFILFRASVIMYTRPLATALIAAGKNVPISSDPAPYRIWGEEGIDSAAIDQLKTACNLPVSTQAALMPDAHLGYGLPIGGVLATLNAVIPYAVGVDIGCRMKLTVLDLPADELEKNPKRFENALLSQTRFGAGNTWDKPRHHDVLDADWSITPVTREMKDKAVGQLGTSGGGNHFVEFGTISLLPNSSFRIPHSSFELRH